MTLSPLVPLIIAAVAAAPLPALEVERFGLYVVSEDLDRSARFYEALLGTPPQVRTPGMVGFDVAGGLYAIVSKQAYAPDARRGETTMPYIKVRDIDAAFARARAVAPASLLSDRVVGEGAFRFFKLADPDGNVVEFFSVTAP